MTTQQNPFPDKKDLSFATSDTQSPLRHFKGRMVDYEPIPSVFTDQATGNVRQTLRVKFQFDQLQVIQSVVPYNLKTAELFVNWSERGGAWAVLGNSIEAIYGEGTKVAQVAGKVHEWKWLPGHATRRQNPETKQWEDTTFEAWVCVSIDGQGGGDSGTPAVPGDAQDDDTILLEIADGKSAPEFNQAAMLDARVKTNTPLLQKVAISGDAVLAAYEAQGKLKLGEDGKYHKVG